MTINQNPFEQILRFSLQQINLTKMIFLIAAVLALVTL